MAAKEPRKHKKRVAAGKSGKGSRARRTKAPERDAGATAGRPDADRAGAGHGSGDGPTQGAEANAFSPEDLESSVIALPLLEKIGRGADAAGLSETYDVIIDLNLQYPGGRKLARDQVEATIQDILGGSRATRSGRGDFESKTEPSEQYVFARLRGVEIRELVRRDRESSADGSGSPERRLQAIYRIWPDFEIKRLTVKSISTVKADAALSAFGAHGKDIVWAVLDSGIDASHPHFDLHENLKLGATIRHHDFTSPDHAQSDEAALHDEYDHGTHVAGIIAGALSSTQRKGTAEEHYRLVGQVNQRDETGTITPVEQDYPAISGMAPSCKLLSLKVLRADGRGTTSSLIAAIEYIQRLNGYGRRLLVHGVNMSVGYDFDPEWFACGQSPLCVEVDRLARSGVVVVVAAGNTGYGRKDSEFRGSVAAGMDLTINDPGNAELAVTVGSTHRDMPHTYGVSYFSSKGPTGDGRMKPDLVAPGEKIVSCASSLRAFVPQPAAGAPDRAPAHPGQAPELVAAALAGKAAGAKRAVKPDADPKAPTIAHYRENSGTSMAAPHVSGVIAAFLSVRREFIGQPEKVKRIFLDTATDLRRTPSFQGRGLVDLMRAIQSV